MSITELRANIAHQLDCIHNPLVLEEIEAMIDFKVSEPVYHFSDREHLSILQALQEIEKGEFISDEDLQKSVELCLNGN
jgi:hypothetical protein